MTIGRDESASLGSASLRAAAWVGVVQASTGLMLLGIRLMLARYLGPADMGLVEIALSFFLLALVLLDLGTGAALIARRDLTPAFTTAVLVVNLAASAMLGALLALGAPLVTLVLGLDDRLVGLLRGVALCALLLGLGILPRSLLVREMAFRRLAGVTFAGAAVAIVVGALAAVGGRGVDAFTWSLWAYVGTSTALLWMVTGHRPALALPRGELREVARFGLTVSAASVIDQLGQQLEQLLVAWLLGPAGLGILGAARTYIRGSLRTLMSVSDTVLLPGLAQVGADHERGRRYYTMAVRFELVLFGPAVVFLALLAPILVPFLLGPGWERAGHVALLLAPLAWRTITAHSVGAIFLSHHRPDLRLRWVLLAVLLNAGYVLAGSPWGVEGVAVAYSLLGVIGWSVSHIMANRLLGLGFVDFLRALGRPLASHLALAGFVVGGGHLLGAVGVAPFLQLALLVPLGLGFYALVLARVDPELARGFVGAISAAFSRRRPPVPDPTPDPPR